MQERWLEIDPLKSCLALFSQEHLVHRDTSWSQLKDVTVAAFKHFRKQPHPCEDVRELILAIDGGAARSKQGRSTDATWAIAAFTRGKDGTLALLHFFGGGVPIATDDPTYIGAEGATSMAAETSAEAHAAIYLLGRQHGLPNTVPVSVVYDNEIAARFARANASSSRHHLLHATVGTLWQIASSRFSVEWAHVYSHFGSPINEFADTLVELMAWHPEVRSTQHCPCSTLAREYTPSQIKLMYLLHLPDSIQHAYPRVN